MKTLEALRGHIDNAEWFKAHQVTARTSSAVARDYFFQHLDAAVSDRTKEIARRPGRVISFPMQRLGVAAYYLLGDGQPAPPRLKDHSAWSASYPEGWSLGMLVTLEPAGGIYLYLKRGALLTSVRKHQGRGGTITTLYMTQASPKKGCPKWAREDRKSVV